MCERRLLHSALFWCYCDIDQLGARVTFSMFLFVSRFVLYHGYLVLFLLLVTGGVFTRFPVSPLGSSPVVQFVIRVFFLAVGLFCVVVFVFFPFFFVFCPVWSVAFSRLLVFFSVVFPCSVVSFFRFLPVVVFFGAFFSRLCLFCGFVSSWGSGLLPARGVSLPACAPYSPYPVRLRCRYPIYCWLRDFLFPGSSYLSCLLRFASAGVTCPIWAILCFH